MLLKDISLLFTPSPRYPSSRCCLNSPPANGFTYLGYVFGFMAFIPLYAKIIAKYVRD